MTLPRVLLAASLLQLPIGAQASLSAEAFMRNLYQREKDSTRTDEDAFGGRKGAEAIYSAGLLQLIRRDRHGAHGDAGKLDYDPICGCQDSDGLRMDSLQVRLLDGLHAKVVAHLSFSGPDKRVITYALIRSSRGWRVDDVDDSSAGRSLRNLLRSKP